MKYLHNQVTGKSRNGVLLSVFALLVADAYSSRATYSLLLFPTRGIYVVLPEETSTYDNTYVLVLTDIFKNFCLQYLQSTVI